MKKTSVYLDPELDHALGRRASERGMTKAELIRQALAREVAEGNRPKPAARGVFEGPGDASQNVDRYLDATRFGEAG